jgi:tRNA/rRNA methyltransferase
MKNFGLRDLVLVDPRLHRSGDREGEEPYFERESRRMAWNAADVLRSARTANSLREAVEDCVVVLATAPRAYSGLPGLTPEEGAKLLAGAGPAPAALIFGSESSGLTKEEVALAAGVVVVPTDPAYRDLNLAQTVVLLAYLCFREGGGAEPPGRAEAASHAEVEAVAEALRETAREVGFLQHGGEPVARQLKGLVHRAGLSRREAGLLRSLGRRIRARLRPSRRRGAGKAPAE